MKSLIIFAKGGWTLDPEYPQRTWFLNALTCLSPASLLNSPTLPASGYQWHRHFLSLYSLTKIGSTEHSLKTWWSRGKTNLQFAGENPFCGKPRLEPNFLYAEVGASLLSLRDFMHTQVALMKFWSDWSQPSGVLYWSVVQCRKEGLGVLPSL